MFGKSFRPKRSTKKKPAEKSPVKKFWFSGFRPIDFQEEEDLNSTISTIMLDQDSSSDGSIIATTIRSPYRSPRLTRPKLDGQEAFVKPIYDNNSSEFVVHIANLSSQKINQSDMKEMDPLDRSRGSGKEMDDVFTRSELNGTLSRLDSPIQNKDIDSALSSALDKAVGLDGGDAGIFADIGRDVKKDLDPRDCKEYQKERKIDPSSPKLDQSVLEIHQEYKLMFDQAKQESKEYIHALRTDLEFGQQELSAVRAENSRLHQIRENEEKYFTENMQAMNDDMDAMKQIIQDFKSKEKGLELQLKEAQGRNREMSFEMELLNHKNEDLKKQSDQQEEEFEIFGKKIRMLQNLIGELEMEKTQLKSMLRKAQYNPPQTPPLRQRSPSSPHNPDSELQKQLEQANFDVESLKYLAQELENENEELRSEKLQKFSRTHSRVDSRLSHNASLKSESTGFSSRWAIPSNKEKQFGTSINDRVPRSMAIMPPETSTISTDEFYSRKQDLEEELRDLTEERSKLTFDLSRVPSTGAKSLKRKDELETMLDLVEHRMSSVRRKMKEFGVL